MFTGIVEEMAVVTQIYSHDNNLDIWIKSSFTHELKIDQSVAHNGICLTVVAINNDEYKVTAIAETIAKTTIGLWKISDKINVERGMKLTDRLDGHIVQGHIDQTGTITHIEDANGSKIYTITYNSQYKNITIEKGSITVDGTSLTVIDAKENEFSVAIIPYTHAHTLFQFYKINTMVNLEFDVIGKYIKRLYHLHQ